MTIVAWILVIVSISSMMFAVGSRNSKPRIVCDVSNALLMLMLLVRNVFYGEYVMAVFCGIAFCLNVVSLTWHIREYRISKIVDRYIDSENKVKETKRVLKEFIKEIEEYGSKRH